MSMSYFAYLIKVKGGDLNISQRKFKPKPKTKPKPKFKPKSRTYFQKLILLHTTTSRQQSNYHTLFRGWLFWKTCTDHLNVNIFHDDVAHIESYVCQPNDGGRGISDIEMGYLFGGFYCKNTTNNVTGDMTCPDQFTKHNLFDIVVCLSRDYRDRRFSVELGGFFSCQTKKEEASCPTGFVQHLATTIEGCDVYVCLGTDTYMRLKLPLIKR